MQCRPDYDFSKYLELTSQKGKQVSAKCPFHDDKNPSFSGNAENGLWQCWSCGKKGNWLQLLKQLNNLKNNN